MPELEGTAQHLQLNPEALPAHQDHLIRSEVTLLVQHRVLHMSYGCPQCG